MSGIQAMRFETRTSSDPALLAHIMGRKSVSRDTGLDR